MLIDPKEIESVEEVGTLDKSKKIKMVRTIGGLNLAVGSDSITDKEKVLAYASHPAIVKHQLRKRYNARFAENLQKNESGVKEQVVSFEKNLSKSLVNSGYDIYCLKKGTEAKFVVTCDNIEVMSSELSDIKIENAKIQNFEKYKEFIQNEGKEALMNSMKQHITGK
jgi:hypothetical protein